MHGPRRIPPGSTVESWKPVESRSPKERRSQLMKAIPIVSGLALVTAVAGLAFAHPGMPKGQFFERMDSNKDGKVTLVEAEALGKSKFTELDKNKDNVLVADELKGP